ncbi:MAG: UvrD-helicase domain-containing protein [Patescibacteria group bacterium]
MAHTLNEEQTRAAAHQSGALLILAGAGAGKTRVIVERIATLIKNGVAPEHILAVTFTNKAAAEMRERIATRLRSDLSLSPFDTPATSPFIGTFHALSLHIIKTFHDAAGLPRRFTIYDRADSTRAVKEAIRGAGFDPKELEPRRVMGRMGRMKGDDVSREDFLAEYASSYIDEAIAEVWERYDAILKKENALDFDDILVRALWLLRTNPSVRDHFQTAWEYIHVDEYQDTNNVQYALIKLLAESHGNIAVVGDIDQNIYSWRGASIKHIMNFEADYPSASLVMLTRNYRSTKTIIAAANEAIAKNIHRREKELVTDNPDGDRIKIGGFMDEGEEARYVAHESQRLIKNGVDKNDIAVLYRANFQSRVLEEAFLSIDVPYQVLGTRFFERKEVKDALSYLRAALNPESVADISRIINVPARGIGKVGLSKILLGQKNSLAPAVRIKVEQFYALLARIKHAAETKTTSEAVKYALTESGTWRMYERGDTEDEERLENLKELVTVATKYDAHLVGEGIDTLIEEAALQSDQDELAKKEGKKKDGVKLMTVHAAKGLEFDSVFIVGLEDGLFPHERDEADQMDREEERRLFYVALTRAEKRAYMTYAASRQIFGSRNLTMPSEFITELDPAYTELINSNDMYHRSHGELDGDDYITIV